MDVSAIMTRRPITVPPDTTVDAALQIMADQDVRHLPVVADGRLLGVISDRDLLQEAGWLPRPQGRRPVEAGGIGDLMHTDLSTVAPDDTVVTAVVDFVLAKIGCLPVLDGDDGAVVGIVTEMDVLRAYWKACREGRLEGDVDPPVREHMAAHVRTVARTTTLEMALRSERSIHVRHLPVTEGDRVVGMISDRDLRAAQGEGRPPDTPLGELMSEALVTIGPDEPLSTAAHHMADQKFSSLPVVEDGHLVGLVTLSDVLDHCIDTLREPEAG